MDSSHHAAHDAAIAPILTGDIHATLNFIVPQDAKPYFLSSALTGGEAELHFETEPHTVAIHDVRAEAADYSIDEQGFSLVRHQTAVDDLYDDTAVADIYGRELEGLLKQLTGASRVVVFDHTRRSDAPAGAANPDGSRGPASLVHVDYTPLSGPERARTFLGAEDYDQILTAGGRIVQVNVWRPIKGPVQRSPLALADAKSVRSDELIATEQKYANRVGEIFFLEHGTGQRWCWIPGMDRDEVIVLKGWDSQDDGRAIFTPHSAFTLPDQDAAAPPRESIESRTYLVFDA
jgi:hypothetical protein